MATNGVEDVAPTAAAPSQEEIRSQFELGIALALWEWPNLTLAVENQWGGPDSADKRDWLPPVIADEFSPDKPDPDVDYIAQMLLQAMEDEFNVAVEDDSDLPVAQKILELRRQTQEGDFSTVQEMHRKFLERKGKAVSAPAVMQGDGGDQETDWDSEDDDEEDEEDGDVEMGDAPPPAPKEKAPPEMDEEGFTKVVGKKRR